MRPTTLLSHRSVLEALRSGAVPFDAVARDVRSALENRADRFLRVWRWSGQGLLEREDLVQEMMVALWRAVDSWDPERADLLRYVDAQLGRACQRRLRQASGYPDPRRSAPARQVDVGEAEDLGAVMERRGSIVPALGEDYVDARRRADALLERLVGLERQVVGLVLEGLSIESATRVIYADPSTRITYRMDSIRDARRMVGDVVKRVTMNAASAA